MSKLQTQAEAWASEGKPSPRTQIVYNIEPFRAGIRQGDWKLNWRTRCRKLSNSITSRRIPPKRITLPQRIRRT